MLHLVALLENNVVSEHVRHIHRAVQAQKMARDWTSRGFVLLLYLICVFVAAHAECWFSHDLAHFATYSFSLFLLNI